MRHRLYVDKLTLAVTSEALGKINAHFCHIVARISTLLALIDEVNLTLVRGLATAAVVLLAFALVASGSIDAVGVRVTLGSFLRAFVDLVTLSLAVTSVAIFAFARVTSNLISADSIFVTIELFGGAFIDV